MPTVTVSIEWTVGIIFWTIMIYFVYLWYNKLVLEEVKTI